MSDKIVSLENFEEEYLEQLLDFQLPDDQIKFSALPGELLNTSKGQYKIVITYENNAAGFFLLNSTRRVKDYSENPKAMLLTALTIDSQYQGKGIAKYGMLSLPKFVKENFPLCNEIILVVNCENIPAQSLYKKTGFNDSNKRFYGPLGKQVLMSLPIKA
ncbi:GNAT family N-acetyltransferase [Shouchella miscanthi]|uniref:GNAT family N-acetyltransferase n=1 Tax=Shouchella miscanthi TaxID=2598861 RepID=A0ABU6NR51_9BACI|nr:GNAT family N-acetyltransferase [Shouchella miscanthi]MED4130656.1 GNAT family N-acetyltransferase [Shouchella miscanthi]